ncbi:NRDE family protein [Mesobacillus subterraneus]|uniref:NRDE family protein n=2 Tax=Mesobacillus subterraneus TaxID=285983 RepID=A0A3R9FJJ5_9BACI|nr:NRDE family protein [Mesobacillus subterraneus]RSD29469.1 NRDE family protein [Mesobacillus subterraneus]
MCLILFAYKAHPKYKLIVAANRDEFYDRPTAPANFWEDAPEILAGRDLEKMGTWMGVSTSGKFAALTNYRGPKESGVGKRTRGELVADYLKGTAYTKDYLEKLSQRRHDYPGYNFLAGDLDHLYYYSTRGGQIQTIQPGIHGVSNHLLNTNWPKVERGKAGLAEIVANEHGDLPELLFAQLENADPAHDDMLPSTGVSLEWERLLSPMFIKSEGYGTRSSTVILMDENEILFKERVFSQEERTDQEFLIRL